MKTNYYLMQYLNCVEYKEAITINFALFPIISVNAIKFLLQGPTLEISFNDTKYFWLFIKTKRNY